MTTLFCGINLGVERETAPVSATTAACLAHEAAAACFLRSGGAA